MKTSRSKAIKRARQFTLESLENRTLLNASSIAQAIDWHELEHQYTDAYAKEGYGHADPIFSDPSAWDTAFLESVPYNDSSDTTPGGCTVCTGCGRCTGSQASQTSEIEDSLESDIEGLSLDDVFSEPLTSTSTAYTLYLNFDAARVYSQSGDFWLGSTYIDVPGYDLSMFGWDGYESQSIDYITNFVTEDYAAYNVTVTNTEPTNGEYTTIYVGGTSDWFQANSNIIGVASYDINNRDASNYGFAFTEELGTYYNYSGGSLLNFSEYVANLISHEAAHTFGANHINDPSYLMNPYLPTSPRTSSFGVGTISNSSSTQDTQDLLGNNMGYLGSLDDYGDTVSSAETISMNTNTISGLLEKITDTDAFTFTADASGTFTVDLSTTVYGNLDSTLTIYDANNNQIAYNDDYYSSNDSLVSFNVTQGQEYTIVVGSSNYETSGTYMLSFTAPEGTPEIEVTDTEGSSSDLTIDFGDIYIGQQQTYTVKIANSGLKALTISQISTTGDFDFSIPNNKSSNLNISAGDYTTIEVTFEPNSVSSETGQIIIRSNDADNSTIIINVSGTGLANDPDIEIANTENGTIDFGSIMTEVIGSGTITVNNTGINTLEISSFDVPDGFNIDIDTLSIAPGESETISIWFTSNETVSLNGELVIYSNDPDESVTTVILTAEIYSPEDYIANTSLSFEEADGVNDGIIDGGSIETGKDSIIDLWIISNNGSTDVTLDVNRVLGSVFAMPTEITIASGETYTLSTTFNSSSAYTYTDEIAITFGEEQATAPLTLTVEAYAEFGDRDKFEFFDSDGDFVSVILKNATGRITLNSDGSPDIKNIEISNNQGNASLVIKTDKDGHTTVGDITGSGEIKSITGKTTDLAGEINIDGTVGKIQLDNIQDEASIDIETDYKGTSLQFNNTEGKINIDGLLKGIKATGDIGGEITVNGDIKSIKTSYNINATINAYGYINAVNALNLDNADIESSSYIKTVNVKGDMIDTSISAGYSNEFGYGEDYALINKLSVKGLFMGSTVESGLMPENKGSMYNSDTPVVTINNIKIGSVITDNNGETFGIFAGGYVNKVTVGKVKITEDYQENDFVVLNEQ